MITNSSDLGLDINAPGTESIAGMASPKRSDEVIDCYLRGIETIKAVNSSLNYLVDGCSALSKRMDAFEGSEKKLTDAARK
jgi:hypothetical protein